MAMVTLFLAGSAIASAAVVGALAGDPQTAKTLWVLEKGFSDVIGSTLIVFMLGVSIVSITQGDPPRWLGWAGQASSQQSRWQRILCRRTLRSPSSYSSGCWCSRSQ
jgi:hypothetical protein